MILFFFCASFWHVPLLWDLRMFFHTVNYFQQQSLSFTLHTAVFEVYFNTHFLYECYRIGTAINPKHLGFQTFLYFIPLDPGNDIPAEKAKFRNLAQCIPFIKYFNLIISSYTFTTFWELLYSSSQSIFGLTTAFEYFIFVTVVTLFCTHLLARPINCGINGNSISKLISFPFWHTNHLHVRKQHFQIRRYPIPTTRPQHRSSPILIALWNSESRNLVSQKTAFFRKWLSDSIYQ